MDFFANVVAHLGQWWTDTPTTEIAWLGVGFLAQLMFSMRFIVQWLTSEGQGRSVIPIAFWYFSIGGGAVLLLYAIWRQDPVIICGQGLGLFIYLRNLFLIKRPRSSQSACE